MIDGDELEKDLFELFDRIKLESKKIGCNDNDFKYMLYFVYKRRLNKAFDDYLNIS